MRHHGTAVQIVASNLALEAELERVVRALRLERIDCVVLKGTTLMRQIGEPLSARVVADNDLLVKAGGLEAAENALVQMGYRARDGSTLALSLASGAGQRSLGRVSDGVGYTLDLHWSAFHAPFRGVPAALVWSRTREVRLGQEPIRVLDPAMTIIHIAAHFVWHAMGQTRLLRTLGAAWNTWRDVVEIDDLRHLAARIGALPSLEYSLTAAHKLGFAASAVGLTSSRAALALRLLPPGALKSPRPVPDYERIALSLVLVSTRRAAVHLLRFLAPTRAQAAILASSTQPVHIMLSYLRRPWHAVDRWGRYRRALRNGGTTLATSAVEGGH